MVEGRGVHESAGSQPPTSLACLCIWDVASYEMPGHCLPLVSADHLHTGPCPPDYSSRPENFTCLVECRRAVAQDLGLQEADLALSMGMSGDYQAAIAMGATHVRVGSSIFGARDYSKA